MAYRYQEWTDGVHNFDDHTLLSIYMCHFLRNTLQTHQAVGSAMDVLEKTSGKTYPSRERVLQAYLSFEALSDLGYTYACVSCGYHPVSVVMDLHEKGVFRMPVSSIEEPSQTFDGKATSQTHLSSIPVTIAGLRGLVLTQEIGMLYSTLNTKKCILLVVQRRNLSLTTEDRLTDELLKVNMEAVRALCRQCGIDPKGSRMDLVTRLQQEMKQNNHFLDMMTPSSHVFLMQNILYHYNNARNSRTIESMKKRLGKGVDIQLNSNGQTVLAPAEAPAEQAQTTTAAPAHGMTTAASPGDLPVCSDDCWGLPHLEHTSARSEIRDSEVRL
ncbi:uncharacterized protein [Paramormyrops kingsleyae]|uniref:uncharacterized protein n=1 Tax=Paramormyrops kingsleyae TaxID=1676925 RepID=UPI003B96A469